MLQVYRDEKMPGKKEISLLAVYGPMTLGQRNKFGDLKFLFFESEINVEKA